MSRKDPNKAQSQAKGKLLSLGFGALLACACHASRGSWFSPEDWLKVGVVPRLFMDEITKALQSQGFVQHRRWDGEYASAACFEKPFEGRQAIRVVTQRGLVLVLDREASQEWLWELDAITGEDLTGDGQPEIVIARIESERECLLVIQLRQDGGLSPIWAEQRGLDPASCIERLEDIDGDGRFEAWLSAEFMVENGENPIYIRLPVLLRLDERKIWVPSLLSPAQFRQFLKQWQAKLGEAIRKGDVNEAQRIAAMTLVGAKAYGREGEAERVATDLRAILPAQSQGEWIENAIQKGESLREAMEPKAAGP